MNFTLPNVLYPASLISSILQDIADCGPQEPVVRSTLPDPRVTHLSL